MLRLTGGQLRGRQILTPKNISTRPSGARVREALFNSIQTLIHEAKVLDLFAGSGTLGFEALSRGAQSCVFVDKSIQPINLIKKNAKSLGLEAQIQVIFDGVGECFEKMAETGPYDIILVDPPYSDPVIELFGQNIWKEILSENGVLCYETSSKRVSELAKLSQFLVKIRQKTYGDTVLTTFTRGDKVE
jgi:16S rRNA (guanine966-N2)-methyltransferase